MKDERLTILEEILESLRNTKEIYKEEYRNYLINEVEKLKKQIKEGK